MKESAHEINMDALNADIARSREETAALAADLKKLAEWKLDDDKRNAGRSESGISLDAARARGERAAKSLAEGIKRHPLLAGAAAFGLGFAAATLLFRRRGPEAGK